MANWVVSTQPARASALQQQCQLFAHKPCLHACPVSCSPQTPPQAERVSICSIEKANGALNKMIQEQRLHELVSVTIDEAHMLADPNRCVPVGVCAVCCEGCCVQSRPTSRSQPMTPGPCLSKGVAAKPAPPQLQAVPSMLSAMANSGAGLFPDRQA